MNFTDDAIVEAVLAERQRQREKFGDDQFRLNSPAVNLAILCEECGEVAQAVLKAQWEQLELELVQVAAVCFAWLEWLWGKP